MNQRLTDLGGSHTPRTYSSVVLELDQMTEPLDFAMAVVRHLESVVTTPELRAAYNAVQEPVSMFYTSIPLDRRRVGGSEAGTGMTDPADARTGAPAFASKKPSADFRRAGADLDEAGKKKLEEFDVALTKATTKFSENVLDATNAFELLITEENKLAGLPESAAHGRAGKREVEGQGRLAPHFARPQLHCRSDLPGRSGYPAGFMAGFNIARHERRI